MSQFLADPVRNRISPAAASASPWANSQLLRVGVLVGELVGVFVEVLVGVFVEVFVVGLRGRHRSS
jgi:hypothetical protein